MTTPFSLIIEDDPDLSDIFAEAMRSAGYEAEVIRDGRTALQRLEVIKAAVIILDLHLPNVSGEAILDHIRSDPKFETTRVIITTADAIMAEMLRDKADIVMVKPVSFAQLRDMATRFLPRE